MHFGVKKIDEVSVIKALIDEFIWEEKRTFQFSMKLFCLIPFGTHNIHMIKFQKASYEVYTNEEYTDEVELYAGWKTPFVDFWANRFYTHRQKKWLKLL